MILYAVVCRATMSPLVVLCEYDAHCVTTSHSDRTRHALKSPTAVTNNNNNNHSAAALRLLEALRDSVDATATTSSSNIGTTTSGKPSNRQSSRRSSHRHRSAATTAASSPAMTLLPGFDSHSNDLTDAAPRPPHMIHDGDRKTFAYHSGNSGDDISEAQDAADSSDNYFHHFLEACSTAASLGGTEAVRLPLNADRIVPNNNTSAPTSVYHEWANNPEDDDVPIQPTAVSLRDLFFHVYCKEQLFFCCIGDDPDTRDQKVAFAFLDSISESFLKLFSRGRILRATAMGMQKVFEPTIRSHMHYHIINAQRLAVDARVQAIQTQVSDVNTVMGRNIDLILQRGERVERLHRQSLALEQDAAVFKKHSLSLRRGQERKYYFMAFVCAAVTMTLLYLSVIGVCGSGLRYCRKSTGNGDNSSANTGGYN